MNEIASSARVVIVGGGLAAVRTAQALRDLGHRGSIRIISEEAEPPYDRPPLSKDYLLGQLPDTAIQLLEPTAYRELDIDIDLGQPVIGLDAAAHTVTLRNGSEVAYDRLVVATGARARSLDVFSSSTAAFPLRTADDSRRLGAAIRDRSRIAVVGAGFIGLEVAAAAHSRGCEVTVVEAQPAPLVGVLGPRLAAWLQAQHTACGVTFRCGVTVQAATTGEHGERLELSDGSWVEADAVVVGVGIVRDTGWLAAAGLEVHHGLVCDADGRTSQPDIFGVGDIVCQHEDGGCAPIQHWTAASASARRAAYALLGAGAPPAPDDGYFWSDQFHLRLQFAGRAEPDAEPLIVAGNPDDGAFVAQLRKGDRPTGVFAANSPRDFLKQRMAIRRAVHTPDLVQEKVR